MNDYSSLDTTIYRFGFYCAVLLILSGFAAAFLPLDISDGLDAEHTDRIVWLTEHRATFVLGWLNQIVAMLTLSGVFVAMAWQTRQRFPLTALLSAAVVAFSVMAFIVPKFIAVWSMPLLVSAVNDPINGEMANTLLMLLNVTTPYSLFTSFDYLGFWLYAVFGLLITRPFLQGTTSSKIAGTCAGLYGATYHILLVALLSGVLENHQIGTWFLSTTALLIIVVIATMVGFWRHGQLGSS